MRGECKTRDKGVEVNFEKETETLTFYDPLDE